MQAGLEPLSVYTYSQLYMLLYGSTVYNVPIGTAATTFFTQVCFHTSVNDKQ
jgi:hypothetical protein